MIYFISDAFDLRDFRGVRSKGKITLEEMPNKLLAMIREEKGNKDKFIKYYKLFPFLKYSENDPLIEAVYNHRIDIALWLLEQPEVDKDYRNHLSLNYFDYLVKNFSEHMKSQENKEEALNLLPLFEELMNFVIRSETETENVLSLAITLGRIDIIELMLEEKPTLEETILRKQSHFIFTCLQNEDYTKAEQIINYRPQAVKLIYQSGGKLLVTNMINAYSKEGTNSSIKTLRKIFKVSPEVFAEAKEFSKVLLEKAALGRNYELMAWLCHSVEKNKKIFIQGKHYIRWLQVNCIMNDYRSTVDILEFFPEFSGSHLDAVIARKTLLTQAAEKEDYYLIRLLLQKGANQHQLNGKGWTYNRYLENSAIDRINKGQYSRLYNMNQYLPHIIKGLLANRFLMIKDKVCSDIMEYAVKGSDLAAIYKIFPDLFLKVLDDKGFNPLLAAVYHKQFKIAKWLLNKTEINKNHVDKSGRDYRFWLHKYCGDFIQNGSEEKALELLNTFENFSSNDLDLGARMNGETLLSLAFKKGNGNLVITLIEKGARSLKSINFKKIKEFLIQKRRSDLITKIQPTVLGKRKVGIFDTSESRNNPSPACRIWACS